MTRAREWQVSLDFKARLDEDAAFDLMEALGRYGASVAVDPGHTGGGLTLAVDAPDGETALAKARTLLEENMPGATVTGLEAREWADAVARNREPLYPPVVGYAEIARMTGVTRQRAYAFPRIESFPKPVIETSQGPLYSEDAAQTRTSESDGIGNDARAPRPHGAGFIFYKEEAAVPRWIRREGNRPSPGPVRLDHGTCGPVPEPE